MIDPEFTVFAPPGLDAGSLMSGFVLAHLYHTQQGLPPAAAVPPGEEEGEGGPPLELSNPKPNPDPNPNPDPIPTPTPNPN